MKIVTTGDWHVHNFTDFSTIFPVTWDESLLRYVRYQGENPEVSKDMNSRLFNILNGLCDMRDYCLTNNINNVLMAGDCFHKRGTIEVSTFNSLYQVIQSFRTCEVELHMISGNHDNVDSSIIPENSIHSFEKIAHIIETPEAFTLNEDTSEGDPVTVIAIPYSKDKDFVLSEIERLKNECDHLNNSILMAHVGITGGTVGSGMYSMKDEYTLKELQTKEFKYATFSHYHQPQLLDYNAVYAGTPVQNSFSDELKGVDGYNGFFVLDTDKRYDITFVPIIAPRFVTVSSAKELSKLDSDFLNANYVRIKSSAKDAEEIQGVLEDLSQDIEALGIRMELEKEYAKEHRSDIGVSQSFEETLETYTSENFGKDEEGYSELLKVGLDILSKATVGGA